MSAFLLLIVAFVAPSMSAPVADVIEVNPRVNCVTEECDLIMMTINSEDARFGDKVAVNLTREDEPFNTTTDINCNQYSSSNGSESSLVICDSSVSGLLHVDGRLLSLSTEGSTHLIAVSSGSPSFKPDSEPDVAPEQIITVVESRFNPSRNSEGTEQSGLLAKMTLLTQLKGFGCLVTDEMLDSKVDISVIAHDCLQKYKEAQAKFFLLQAGVLITAAAIAIVLTCLCIRHCVVVETVSGGILRKVVTMEATTRDIVVAVEDLQPLIEGMYSSSSSEDF